MGCVIESGACELELGRHSSKTASDELELLGRNLAAFSSQSVCKLVLMELECRGRSLWKIAQKYRFSFLFHLGLAERQNWAI